MIFCLACCCNPVAYVLRPKSFLESSFTTTTTATSSTANTRIAVICRKLTVISALMWKCQDRELYIFNWHRNTSVPMITNMKYRSLYNRTTGQKHWPHDCSNGLNTNTRHWVIDNMIAQMAWTLLQGHNLSHVYSTSTPKPPRHEFQTPLHFALGSQNILRQVHRMKPNPKWAWREEVKYTLYMPCFCRLINNGICSNNRLGDNIEIWVRLYAVLGVKVPHISNFNQNLGVK